MTVKYQDSFSTNGPLSGPSWYLHDTIDVPVVSSDTVSRATQGERSIAAVSSSHSSDQYAKVSIAGVASGSILVFRLYLRMAPPDGSGKLPGESTGATDIRGYFAELTYDSVSEILYYAIKVAHVTGGLFTEEDLTISSFAAFASTIEFRVKDILIGEGGGGGDGFNEPVEGIELSLYIGGFLEWVEEIPARHLSGGHPGFAVYDLNLDNWESGDLGTSGGPLELSGICAASSQLSGSLLKVSTLSGTCSAQSSVEGNLAVPSDGNEAIRRALLSRPWHAYYPEPDGSLSRTDLRQVIGLFPRQGPVNVSGAIAASSDLSGELKLSAALAGSLAASTDLQASAKSSKSLSGSVPAASTLAASAQVTKELSGSVTASAQCQAEAEVSADLQGQVSAQSELEGQLTSPANPVQANLRRAILSRPWQAYYSIPDGDLALLDRRMVAGLLPRQSTMQFLELSGTVSATSSLSAELGSQKGLSGSSTASAQVSGQVGVSKAIDGDVLASSAISGDLRKASSLAGLAAASSTLQAQASAQKNLVGSVDVQASVSGTLSSTMALAGSLGATSTLTGSLDGAAGYDLSGVVSASSSLAGNLSANQKLSGSVASASVLDGTLVVVKNLSSTSASTASLIATLSQTAQLSGEVSAQSALEGDLSTVVPDAQSNFRRSLLSRPWQAYHPLPDGGLNQHDKRLMLGLFALSLTFVNYLELSGTVAASSALQADLKVTASVDGSVAAASTFIGTLQQTSQLSGQLAAVSTFTGQIFEAVTLDLSGVVEATSSLAADLSRALNLQGTIQAQAAFHGQLSASKLLSGSIGSVSSTQGYLSQIYALQGTLAAFSDLYGELRDTTIVFLRADLKVGPLLSAELLIRSAVSAEAAARLATTAQLSAKSQVSGTVQITTLVTGETRNN